MLNYTHDTESDKKGLSENFKHKVELTLGDDACGLTIVACAINKQGAKNEALSRVAKLRAMVERAEHLISKL